MSKSRKILALACALSLCGFIGNRVDAAPKDKQSHAAPAKRLGIGRETTPQEIAGWDIDIRPDGQGLPQGQGTVKDGEKLYMTHCAACHGEFGESAPKPSPSSSRPSNSACLSTRRMPLPPPPATAFSISG